MDIQRRKPNRLKDYDYSSAGSYFITICTKDRQNILCEIVGATIGRPTEIRLSEYGEIVMNGVENIHKHYECVRVDNYVIMPNHIHLLLTIDCRSDRRPMVAPTISTVIQQFKGYVSKMCGKSIWQKLFHDHIIRNEKDYSAIWEYIEQNPQNWDKDCFCC